MAIITTKIITPTQNVIITPANATIFVTSVERRELVDGDQVSYYDFSATITGRLSRSEASAETKQLGLVLPKR